jgi:NADH:ubiquinone oxidoreductase subunit 5 (subunit L)/multisubunit Na+/H+ antiporter MnhA subunit
MVLETLVIAEVIAPPFFVLVCSLSALLSEKKGSLMEEKILVQKEKSTDRLHELLLQMVLETLVIAWVIAPVFFVPVCSLSALLSEKKGSLMEGKILVQEEKSTDRLHELLLQMVLEPLVIAEVIAPAFFVLVCSLSILLSEKKESPMEAKILVQKEKSTDRLYELLLRMILETLMIA